MLVYLVELKSVHPLDISLSYPFGLVPNRLTLHLDSLKNLDYSLKNLDYSEFHWTAQAAFVMVSIQLFCAKNKHHSQVVCAVCVVCCVLCVLYVLCDVCVVCVVSLHSWVSTLCSPVMRRLSSARQ